MRDGLRAIHQHRHTVLVLDRAFTDESAMTAHLEGLLGARVHQVTVQRVDLVNDTTLIDVRYQAGARAAAETVDAADRLAGYCVPAGR